MKAIITLIIISQGFMVQPSRIELEVAGGKSITRKIIVSNPSPDTIFLRIHTEKFYQDAFGKIKFAEEDDNPYIIINPVEFQVPPGENRTVRVTFRTPCDMPKEIWGMIIITQLPPPEEKFAMIRIAREIGVPYYLIPIGAYSECDIDTSYIKNDTLFFLVSNNSFKHLRARGTFKLETIDKNAIERSEQSIFILPEHTIKLAFPIDTLKQGKYVARLRIDYGGAFAIEGVKSFIINK